MEKLLEQGWNFEIFKNGLGSYTAIAIKANEDGVITDEIVTDEFTFDALVKAIVLKIESEV